MGKKKSCDIGEKKRVVTLGKKKSCDIGEKKEL